MKTISTALGYRIDDPTSRLSKLRFIPRRIYLEFLHDVFAELEGNGSPSHRLGEESIVIVAAIYLVIVEIPGNPVETHHAKLAVGGRARGQ